MKQLIASIFHEHRGCYGYRRIHCELQKRGLKFSGKTVRKLMQQLGLKSPVRLKKYRSYRGNMGLAAENILQRQFKAIRAENAYLKAMQEHLLEKKRQELEKKRKSSGA
ncbi:hypothetical protein BZL68_21340 [Escherichia coli]|nr:hypothetical protein BZL68_21340 [Escherichia coli]